MPCRASLVTSASWVHALICQTGDAYVRASHCGKHVDPVTCLVDCMQIIVMGGSDYGDNGQMWSYRLTNIGTCLSGALEICCGLLSSLNAHGPTTAVSTVLRHAPCSRLTVAQAGLTAEGMSSSMFCAGPGLNAVWVVEVMGHPRIESVSILLPDGSVFMTGGAGAGAARPLALSGVHRPLGSLHSALRLQLCHYRLLPERAFWSGGAAMRLAVPSLAADRG